MPLTLPNLDDRRWVDLVEEARSLIPVYGPEWTDHNVHDPGITLVELFAWIAETDIYRLNQIPERHRRKFLWLLGIEPAGPRPALTVLSLAPKAGTPPFVLPAAVEFEGLDTSGRPVRFRTLRPVSLVPGRLRAVQSGEDAQFTDLTLRLQRGEAVPLFGADAGPGTALYLGLEERPPTDATVTFMFSVADPAASAAERRRLIEEATHRANACRAPDWLTRCKDHVVAADRMNEPRLNHHSVRTSWEYLDSVDAWRAVPPDRIVDDTRAFTINGAIEIRPPAGFRASRVGRVDEELFYLRCRVVSGAYDDAPWLRDVSLNGVVVEQAHRAGFLSWPIPADAVVEGVPPSVGDRAGFRIRLNAGGQATHVSFGGSDLPQLDILEYRAPSATAPGVLAVAADRVGSGSGEQAQEYRLPVTPVLSTGFRLLTLEEGAWTEWSARVDFDASHAGDSHFMLDAQRGMVTFGDGRRGRVPPSGALIVAAFDATRAEAGNLDRDRVNRLVDSPQNRALAASASLGTAKELADRFARIRNAVPAIGGSPAETLEQAEAHALDLARRGHQAVTSADFEALARAVPGTRVARAVARPNLHPAFPCLTAPGVVTVMILPHLPRRRPLPSEGLRRDVAAYLSRRRVIGTRVEVVGPSYTEIAIRASVQPLPHVHAGELQARLIAALDTFLDPLNGGPDGTGWPFGRDVYRSEVLHVLDRTPGVDYVTALEIIRDGRDAQCGNVCLGPDGLTTPGIHSIDIAGGGACLPRDRSR